jgi:hypothetical protein
MAASFRHLAGSSLRRTAVIMVGVLAIEVAFIFSYVGGLSHPYPHEVPIGIVAPASTQRTVIEQIHRQGDQFDPRPYPDAASALRAVREHVLDAFVVIDGSKVDVVVSGSPSPVVATVVERAIAPLEKALGTTFAVHQVLPLPTNDPEGLGPFYLVVGWVVGGYLAASVLGLARGTDPGMRRALLRTAALMVFSIASGVAGALLAGPGLHLFGGNRPELMAMGTLVVFAVAIVATAFQALIGELGIALAVLLFVVVGNPSSGGPYPREFLSGVWRDVGAYIPTGAGLEAVRNIAYFGSHQLGSSLLTLVLYSVVGTAAFLAAAAWHQGTRRRRGVPEPSLDR